MNDNTLPANAPVRAAIFASAAIIYVIGIWPTRWLIGAVLGAAGNPPYKGLWEFIPHVFLYSTLAAICAAIAWFVLWRKRWLEPPQLGAGHDTPFLGALGAAAGIIIIIAYFIASGQGGAIHWIPPDIWSIGGNLFSNFYEEFIFRGFVLAAVSRAFGVWAGVIISSAAWALLHTQYPWGLQAAIFMTGCVLAWIRLRARSIWAPYLSHMSFDIVLDSLIS